MKLQPQTNAPDADLVFTPPETARMLVDALPLYSSVLDPSRGRGAFYDALPAHVSRDWCELAEGRDFLKYTGRVDWIVTNPPWSKMRSFIEHGMRVADHVCYLVTINHVWTKARWSAIREAGFGLSEMLLIDTPPKPWPASGFQVGMVHLERGHTGPINVRDLRASMRDAA